MIKILILSIFFISTSAIQAALCVCSWVPLMIGAQTVTNRTIIETTRWLLPPFQKIEVNGHVVCMGTPPSPSAAQTKRCNTTLGQHYSFSTKVGSNFQGWAELGFTESVGMKYDANCDGDGIKSWCQCCMCTCSWPQTDIIVDGYCNSISFTGYDWINGYLTPSYYRCSKTFKDQAMSLGLLVCTLSYDADNDGQNDCVQRLPRKCRTSCNTGSY